MSEGGTAPRQEADQTITLIYGPALQSAAPTFHVKNGHTITFKLDPYPDISAERVRVKFRDPQFFSAAEFNQGDNPVRVSTTLPLPQRTFADCELIPSGQSMQGVLFEIGN